MQWISPRHSAPGRPRPFRAILTYHVVPGKVSAGDALNAKSAKSVNGQPLAFSLEDGRLKVGGTNILGVDIACDNGVIHAIDAVLLPASSPDKSSDAAAATPDMDPPSRIEDAIGRGVPVFNSGDHGACAKIYHVCLTQPVADERVAPAMRKTLQKVLDRASDESSARDRAWLYRAGLDHAYQAIAH